MSAVLLITLGLGQIIASLKGWGAASLVGPRPRLGFLLGSLLVLAGAWLLPANPAVLWLALPAGPLALALLLLAGSLLPPPHPNRFFQPDHPAHAGCEMLHIPDGDSRIPACWLTPRRPIPGAGVCLIPGAGDHKTMFKHRLAAALVEAGLPLLIIDLPGHGDYRDRPMDYPDCLSVVPAVVQFMRQQGVKRLGIVGLSMGGALALNSLAEQPETARQVDALVILETPLAFQYRRGLVRREIWQTLRAPVLSLLGEMSLGQIRQAWKSGGYRGRLNTSELFARFAPRQNIGRLGDLPLLLVYSANDPIAPAEHGQALQKAAPQAELVVVRGPGHVTLTLVDMVNRQVAGWLKKRLSPEGS
ncbi:MAG: alpha/beta fold hydrolase [Chloroflexi bacterium]|nr:MAG: alpha/beta fold hydrolase [Chloroflexota bacterium]